MSRRRPPAGSLPSVLSARHDLSNSRDIRAGPPVRLTGVNAMACNALPRPAALAADVHAALGNTSSESPVHRSFNFRLSGLVLAGIVAPVVAASAQRSDLTVTPFVSFLPS